MFNKEKKNDFNTNNTVIYIKIYIDILNFLLELLDIFIYYY